MAIQKNRVIYAGTTILASDSPSWTGQTGAYSFKLLKRVQSSSISISNPVTRAKQIGSTDFAYEKYLQAPQIDVGIEYLLSDNSNELILGFNATGNEGFLKNFKQAGKDKNLLFLLSEEDSEDAESIINFSGKNIFSIGNAFVTDYSISAEVGNVPRCSVGFSCLNMVFDNYTSGTSKIPAIYLPEGTKSEQLFYLSSGNLNTSNYLSNQSLKASALRPGDIELQLQQPVMGGIRYSGVVPASISSIEISIPIDRRDLLGFGSNYPYDKKIIYPIIGTLSFNGIFDEAVTGDFSKIFDDENFYDFSFSFKKQDGTTGVKIDVLNAKVESQNFDLSIGSNMTFSSSFSFKIFEEDGFRFSGQAEFYDDDAINFLQSAGITDTTTRQSINTFVTEIKDYDLWNKMSGIYPFVGANSGSFAYNLKDPRNSDDAFRLIFFSMPAGSFTTSGINFTGGRDYANTFFNPHTHLTGLSAHLSFLSLTDTNSTEFDIGCMQNSLGNPRLLAHVEYNNSGIFDCFDFTTGRVSISGINSRAFYTASRVNSDSGFMMLFNSSTSPTKSSLNLNSISGQQRPNLDLYFGTANDAGFPSMTSSDRRFGFFSFGDGLTSGESVNLYSAVKNLQLNLGRNQSVFT